MRGVEIQPKQLNCTVRHQLTDDGESKEELSSGDKNPVVGPIWDDHRKLVKFEREPFGNQQKFVNLEVAN